MRIICACCGRQIVSYLKGPSRHDDVAAYGKAGFRKENPFCYDCGLDLDDNGLFPEERRDIKK